MLEVELLEINGIGRYGAPLRLMRKIWRTAISAFRWTGKQANVLGNVCCNYCMSCASSPETIGKNSSGNDAVNSSKSSRHRSKQYSSLFRCFKRSHKDDMLSARVDSDDENSSFGGGSDSDHSWDADNDFANDDDAPSIDNDIREKDRAIDGNNFTSHSYRVKTDPFMRKHLK